MSFNTGTQTGASPWDASLILSILAIIMNGILFLVIVILVWKYWRRVQATPPQAPDNSAIEMGVMYQNSAETRLTFKTMNTPKDNPGYEGPQVERQEMPVEDEAQEYEEIRSNLQLHGQLKAQEYDLPVEPRPQGYLTPVEHTMQGYATTANAQRYQVPAECGPTGYEVPTKHEAQAE